MPPPAPDTPEALRRAWFDAAAPGHPACAALEAIFDQAAAAIALRGPACWASGRCCHFEHYGHRLYVTGLETAYTLARRPATTPGTPAPGLALASAPAPGCVFQREHLCTVHDTKPLGCRLFFCDRSAQAWQHDVHERLLDQLKRLHERFDLPYRYGEWRAMLALLTTPGP